jgi:hypothetical protein
VSQNSVKLLVTTAAHAEQSITVVEENTKLPPIRHRKINSLEINVVNQDLLLRQCEEVRMLLIDSLPGKGFIHFSNFFSDFSFYLRQVYENELPPFWTVLHSKISKAIMNKDTIMLHDLLKYTIEPIIKETGLPGQAG